MAAYQTDRDRVVWLFGKYLPAITRQRFADLAPLRAALSAFMGQLGSERGTWLQEQPARQQLWARVAAIGPGYVHDLTRPVIEAFYTRVACPAALELVAMPVATELLQ